MLKLYNTLTQSKVEFHKKPGDAVSMYVCGITPYDKVHLGHARCYVTFDVLYRYLKYLGFKVDYVQNFTDIDDKIIARSKEVGKSPKDLAEENIAEYFTRMDALGVVRAREYPRVTEHIPQIIEMVKRLIEKNHAYVVNGDVYFDVKTFSSYGTLSHRDPEELKQCARIEVNNLKRNPLDFALWKGKKEGEPSWQSPWGEGRPGWHIECSTLSMIKLGETLDIHGGGQDLIFPHHENETAQSECATGKPFVKIWMHNGFVTINQQKMSKSLGNFFTLEDIFKKFDPMIVRLFLFSQHYRSPLDFSDDKLEETQRSFQHIKDSLNRINSVSADGRTHMPLPRNAKKINSMEKEFFAAMDDDINTARAVAQIFSMVNFINELASEQKVDAASLALGHLKIQSLLGDILGITVKVSGVSAPDEEYINQLMSERKEARKRKNYAQSDQIRETLKRMGVVLEDTPSGTVWWTK